MDPTISSLVAYVTVLTRSADETARAEDRAAYSQHLAAAAKMFVAAHLGQNAELEALILTERVAYGRGYLTGAPGDAAERAFDTFARTVEGDHAA